ncbi:restriction endonuclease subunit S [Thermomonas sp.]|uniref:restriction endonuclease subunit S n=1 Tax=Thermomonas sp. TaxID=1971895 RepID=UPI002488CEF0|nr:restriction endonuclease subunit S [Thermomonas sp.]MDI1252806.1 restriction endonuclease subunit S [Thermomonas sp.]
MSNSYAVFPLGELCDVLDSKRRPITKIDRVPGPFPYYGATGILDHVADYIFDEPLVLVGEDGAKWASGERTAFAAAGKIWVNNHAHVLRPKRTHLIDQWLIHYLNFTDLSEFVAGLTVPKLNQGSLREIPIPTPSVKEQQRIVAILDEAFAGIATAKANAETNLRNARQIFESHAQSVFSRRDNAWRTTTLGAEMELLVGFAFKSAQYTSSEDDIRLLRGDNIIPGCLRWEDVKKWPASDAGNYDRYRLKEGDVVLAMDRPWIKAGLKRAVISAADVPSLLVQRTACLRSQENIDSRFLMHLISSDGFVQHILGVQSGIGVPHISGQQIKDFEFFIPPMAEQKQIADELESLGAETERIEFLYTRKLTALDELKQSLLHQAFSGQL